MPAAAADEPDAPLVAVGVDGARAGWVAACLHADALGRDGARVWETRLVLARDIDAVAALRSGAGDDAAVAIDVPIGLLDTVDLRACDREARRRLGARASSVFAPPARYMLPAAGDYAAIRALVDERRRTDPAAKGLSAQAAGIAPKVAEVDAFVRAHPETERWLYECHPELSFLTLNDATPVAGDKRSAAGLVNRLALVRDAFPDAEGRIGAAPWPGGRVALDDVLDAYAALATAVACARGEHEELGDGGRDSAGVPMRIALQP